MFAGAAWSCPPTPAAPDPDGVRMGVRRFLLQFPFGLGKNPFEGERQTDDGGFSSGRTTGHGPPLVRDEDETRSRREGTQRHIARLP
jgi:hypothetical protein